LAMLPFARNGQPASLAPLRLKVPCRRKTCRVYLNPDVVRPYGQSGMVLIADTVAEFVAAAEKAMQGLQKIRLAPSVDNF